MLTAAPAVAFGRTLRAVPVRSLAAIAVIVAAPTVITVARGGTNLMFALVAAAVIGGAGFAYAVDDDAAVLLASSPTTLARRRAARLVAALLMIGAGWAVAFATGGLAGLLDGAPLRLLIVEALTAGGVAVATATAATRSGSVTQAGLAGAAVAVLTLLMITAMSQRYAWLPRLGDATQHDRWLWLAAGAWIVALWSSRDPAVP